MATKKTGYILSIVLTIPILLLISHYFTKHFMVPILSFFGFVINLFLAYVCLSPKTLSNIFKQSLLYSLTSIIGIILVIPIVILFMVLLLGLHW